MQAKTMEGLVGASTNMNLLNTPMRVFKEARRRGDTATMERALGYAADFKGKTEEYRKKADEGMEEDVKEAREKEQDTRERAIEKRREERKKLEAELAARREESGQTEAASGVQAKDRVDTVEVSEEGKALAQADAKDAAADTDGAVKADRAADSAAGADDGKARVIYTKSGETGKGMEAGGSVSILA